MTKNSTYPHLVFVYGTLQSGEGNNRVLLGVEGKDATLLGEATTLQKFYMADGGFPRVAKTLLGGFASPIDKGSCFAQIKGEVWSLNDSALKNCDRLEGHPRFYCREQVTVTLLKKRVRLRPWMYLIVEPLRPYECMEKTTAGILEWRRGALVT